MSGMTCSEKEKQISVIPVPMRRREFNFPIKNTLFRRGWRGHFPLSVAIPRYIVRHSMPCVGDKSWEK